MGGQCKYHSSQCGAQLKTTPWPWTRPNQLQNRPDLLVVRQKVRRKKAAALETIAPTSPYLSATRVCKLFDPGGPSMLDLYFLISLLQISL